MSVKLLAVVGPTASGKSALALELALRLSGEIVSCDSMQVYRGMDIGTAKPTEAERRAVRHHMLDVVSPTESYSAADYAVAARAAVHEIAARGAVPILAGGTGLYLEALRRERHGNAPPSDPLLRARLLAEGESEAGRHALHARLSALDPDAAEAIHPNNLRRVVRALELSILTGRTKTALDREAASLSPTFDTLVFRLVFSDRARLALRIDRRVDEMIEAGLVSEVERLYRRGMLRTGTSAAQAIGYAQLLPYLDGQCSLEAATEAIKLATRQYAKRQDTWFRRTEGAIPLTVDEGGRMRSARELADAAMPYIRAHFEKETVTERSQSI